MFLLNTFQNIIETNILAEKVQAPEGKVIACPKRAKLPVMNGIISVPSIISLGKMPPFVFCCRYCAAVGGQRRWQRGGKERSVSATLDCPGDVTAHKSVLRRNTNAGARGHGKICG